MTESQLQALFKQYRVPIHILEHMKKVAAVGQFIAEKLKEKGEKVDSEKVRQGALLHDLVKLCDFKTIDLTYFDEHPKKEDLDFWQKLIDQCHADGHELAGYKILQALGENELALIVKKHGYANLMNPNPNERPLTWEEKIVYYADKRVRFDQIVSLQERIADGQKRYFPDGNIPADDPLVQAELLKLEQEICQKSGLAPEDINDTTVAPFEQKKL